ncbi:hypothetical protein FISHEDRAFT_37782 [Fistulina hepatica ATCC 64428]|nr:hypothetical protein FISHEDRAFT_37782 [Fistulina hepatica ATCC 64428]
MAIHTNDWTQVQPASVPAYLRYSKPIEKSSQDERLYRFIRLQNGLQAMLVHDVHTDKAAASLDVTVGHLYDPDDMPGLAHFCEHLLFMGTEQFPRENEYSEYLAKHNGHSNAYTSTSDTTYYFDVAASSLRGALERFSCFFHSPLFSPSSTSRELNAVDSEHKKNHQQDLWRAYQLRKHLTKPGHPWSKFGSGHRESLTQAAKDLKAKGKLDTPTEVPQNGNGLVPSPIPTRLASPAPSVSSTASDSDADGGAIGRETRRRLVEWWSREYCASRMRLCIIGKESLDELAEMTSQLFSPILNRGRDPLPGFDDHPIGPEQKGVLVWVKSIMDFHVMEIAFPISYQPPLWNYKPAQFLAHLIGHEGPGSLHSYLKNIGWIAGLSAGSQTMGRNFDSFNITVHLTRDGFFNWRSIMMTVFRYLALLRSSPFASYHQREAASLSETRFRFLEKKEPQRDATWIAEHMANVFPPEKVLSATRIVADWDGANVEGGEKTCRAYLNDFTLENSRVTLMAKGEEFAQLSSKETSWLKEPWYGTEYHLERFDATSCAEAAQPNDISEFNLPRPNEFIPTNLDVHKIDIKEPLKRPYLVRQSPLSLLWHKKDDQFWVPKGRVGISLMTPVANITPEAIVATRLYADLVTDALTEFTYDADLAGLSYDLAPFTGGLFITVSGYNDKLSVLLQHVLDKVKNTVVDPSRLAVMAEQAKLEWQNTLLGQSYQLSEYHMRHFLTERLWTPEEKLKALPAVSKEYIEKHIKEMLSQAYLRILVTGNIIKDEAILIAEMAEEGLGVSPVTSEDMSDHGLALPRPNNHSWIMPVPNPNQANSALTYFLHYGSTTDERMLVVSSLLTQILQEPTFNVLRTQEQLGYIVSCSNLLLPGGSLKGMRIVIQSEKNPGYLEDRVEAFLSGMKETLEQMPEEVFETQKTGLKKRWLEKSKNVNDEATRFMAQITNGQFDFLRNERDAALLDEITKSEVMDFFMAYVHPSSLGRAKLSVHARSTKVRIPHVSPAAAAAFEDLVRRADIYPATSWRDVLRDERPSAINFGKFWMDVLGDKPEGKKLLQALPAILAQNPVEGEGDDPKRPGVTYIDDVKAFKQSLQVWPHPKPVEWGDLHRN